MAIIKCPECGHDVSDKAPVCLYCGVEIAGKYIARPVATPRPVARPVTTSAPTQAPVQPPVTQAVQSPVTQTVQTPTPQAVQQPRPVQPRTEPQAPAQPAPRPNPQQAVQQTIQQNPQTRTVQQSVNRPQTVQQPVNRPQTIQQPIGRPQTIQQPMGNAGNGGEIPPTPQSNTPKPKKSHFLIYLILFLILVIGGVVAYNSFTNKENDANKEQSAYKFVMSEDCHDIEKMKAYLDEYTSAPRAHRDSVQARMTKFKTEEREWDDVFVSNSRSAFDEYVKKHPDSPYKSIARHKIDSIDYSRAKAEGTVEAWESYLTQHADGQYINEARRAINESGSAAATTPSGAPAGAIDGATTDAATPAPATPAAPLTVSDNEKQRVDNATTRFFQAINANNEQKIAATIPPTMTRFLNQPNATNADVKAFAQGIANTTTNFNWHINHDSYQVQKKDVGAGNFEYTTTFKATLSKNATGGGNTQTPYNVKATVKQGKVTSLTMTKAQ